MKKLTLFLTFCCWLSFNVFGQKQKSTNNFIGISSEKINQLDTFTEESPHYFDGYKKVKLDGGWTFSDHKGQVLSALRFDEVRNFVNEYAGVNKNDKWGLIGKNGKLAVECKYDLILNANAGKSLGLLNDRWYLISLDGARSTLLEIDRVLGITENQYIVEKNGFKGTLDNQGHFISSLKQIDGVNNLTNKSVNSSNSKQATSLTQRAVNDNPCPVNLDFELGSFTNWSCFTGKVDTVGTTNRIRVTPSAPTNNRHVIYARSNAANFVDPFGLFSKNPPDGSQYAVRLGNTSYNAQAERIRYKIQVPANDSNFSVKYDYAVVFEDPGHTEWSQPRFEARLFDSATNSYVGCASFEYISSSNLPGFAISTLDSGVVYKPWASVFMSLRGYEGKTMYLEFTTADCARGKHWGYAYVDVQSICGQPLNVQYDCNFPYTVQLDAPPGFQTYNWWNEQFTQILATGEHTSLSPGPDTTTRLWLEMLPYQSFGCNDTIALTVSGSFEPSFHASSNQAYCAPHTLQFYNNNIGAVSVTWDFGDGTTAVGDTVNHIFTQTGVYVVSMNVVMPSGCTGTKTDTIRIMNPSGTWSYTGGNFCQRPSIQFQVNANDVISYQWNFGDGSLVQGTQSSIFHTYTANGNYQPSVQLGFGNGCTLTLNGQNSIIMDSVSASFDHVVSSSCGNAVLNLTNTSTLYQTAAWQINQNAFSGNQIQINVNQEMNVRAKLIVSGSTGCKDSVDQIIPVKIFPFPLARVSGPTTICEGNTATYIHADSPSDSIVSVSWFVNGNLVGAADTLYWIAVGSGNQTITCIVTNIHGCADTVDVRLLVKAKPTIQSLNNQSLCSGTNTTAINFSTIPSGAAVAWTNNLISIGLPSSGNGNIASFTAVNNTTANQEATITATPSLNGCVGTPIDFKIEVKPMPTIRAVANQSICAGSNTTALNFNTVPSGSAVTWANNLPSIGLAANGNGNIASFTAVNNTTANQEATITATPSLNGCVGTPIDFKIEVKPMPTIRAVANQSICTGSNTTAINFNVVPNNAVVAWTNNVPSIGLLANGNGNIASFTAVNNTSTNQEATITVTPSLNGCVGAPIEFKLDVKPMPTISAVANQSICAGSNTTAINFNVVPNNAVVAWTNNLSSIGLSASGNGNIASFTAVNNTSTNQEATITATPSLNGCVGAPIEFKLDVKPMPTISAVANQSICAGANTTAINFNVVPNNTVVAWTNNLSSIGLSANGNGNIASFTAVNNTSTNQEATITATPSLNGCVGAPIDFKIEVKPMPTISAVANQSICAGANTTAINFNVVPNNTVVAWTNNLSSIGLSANGNGNIASFTAINNSSANQEATITATPSLNGCVGTPIDFKIEVKPMPTINAVANQSICAGANTTAINFNTVPSGSAVTWTNNLSSIGLSASGNGNIASFTSVNNTTTIQEATITATPSLNGCVGTPIDFTIEVKSMPTINSVANQSICAGSNTTAINFNVVPNNAVVAWTNNLSSIGLSANGNGNITSFTAINNSSANQEATITATPSLNGCVGTPIDFTIEVKPMPTINAVANQSICAGANTTAINFNVVPNNAVVAWTNNLSSIGLSANGNGNITSFTAINNSSANQEATITATPSLNGCVGTPIDFTIEVKPMPTINAVANQSICAGANTTAINFNVVPNNAVVAWTNNLSSIGLSANGNGNIASFTAVNNTSTNQEATITATPSLNGCVGTPIDFKLDVKPMPTIRAVANQSICAGANTTAINFNVIPNNAVVAWTNNLSSIGLSANGNGNIASFTAVNNTSTNQEATITVTPSLNGCVGAPIEFKLDVKPMPTISAVANQSICAGSNTTAINFNVVPNNAVVAWTNNLSSIGLSASGNGNIASFTAVNNTSTNQEATITATSSLNGCVGAPIDFKIAVKPVPIMQNIADQMICFGGSFANIQFTSQLSSTQYHWVNDNINIGLSINGQGNIQSFRPTTNSNDTILAMIRVVPSSAGCLGSPKTFSLSVLPVLDYQVPNPLVVCPGIIVPTTLLQSNVSGTVFTWVNDNPSVGLFANGRGNIPTFQSNNATIQRLTAQVRISASANQCPAVVRTMIIHVDPKPVISPITDRVVCAETNVNSIPVQTTVQGAQIRWTNSNPSIGLSAVGTGIIPSFNAVNTGVQPIAAVISVEAESNSCISNPMSFNLFVNPKNYLDSIFDLKSCPGQMIPRIDFSSPVSETEITWTNDNPSIGIPSSGTGFIPRFQPINLGNETQVAEIVVTANSPFGCVPAIQNFRLSVGALPSLIAQSEIRVCQGSVAELRASGADRYVWTPSAPLSCATCSTTQANIQDTTDFIVEAFNLFGCRKKDTVRINVIHPFELKVAPGDTVCQGEGVQLKAEKATTYQWFPSNGLNQSNIANPIANPIASTRYRVIGTDANNCFSDTGFVYVHISPSPAVEAGPDIQAPSGTTVQLNASLQSATAVNWNWSPSVGLSCSDCPNPKVTVSSNRTYVVTVQNSYGCTSKDTLRVISFCKGAEVFVANAFTPDGDGINDILVVRGIGITIRSFRVFNRWGNLVFEKKSIAPNDYKNGWDGRVKGILAAPDVYVYTVEVVCDNGEVFFHKGNTTLLK